MRVLIVDNWSGYGISCRAMLEFRGHAARLINPPLVFDAKDSSSYEAALVDQIMSEARDFRPDWVLWCCRVTIRRIRSVWP